MRSLITLILGLSFSISLYAQEDKVKELVSQGIQLHDQGNYEGAIEKYKKALSINKNSTSANYELSYTYMTIEKYDEAIKYSKKVIKLDSNNQIEAYTVLGTCYDMTGKPDEAIRTYEEGLSKFSENNLLNYNLALTTFNQKDYDKAEEAAIKAIKARPDHGSSHILLAAIMKAQGERVKSVLSLYYFLMIEPDSKRSAPNFINLKRQLGQGVEKQSDNKINVSISALSAKDSIFGAADMMLSMTAASNLADNSSKKTENGSFIESTKSLFNILGELKKDNTGFWWDFYVTKFNDLVNSDNTEAFCYYISQSAHSDEINNWISENSGKIRQLKDWLRKK